MDSCFTIRVAWRKKLVVKDDLIIKIYRRLAKKRYLRGKHTYEPERIYVPIPSRLHDTVKPFLNQRVRISITHKKDGLAITLHPAETFKKGEMHQSGMFRRIGS